MSALALRLPKGGKGEAALRALLRYIVLHGNVTRSALRVAQVFRHVIGDEASPQCVAHELPPTPGGMRRSRIAIVFPDTSKTAQQELDDACAALNANSAHTAAEKVTT